MQATLTILPLFFFLNYPMDDHYNNNNNKRKKKRGRTRVFTSCFPSCETPFLHHNSDRHNTKNTRLQKRSSHRRLVSRLLKSTLFGSLMVKKIDTKSSKSSTDSDKRKPVLLIENTCKSSDDSNSCGSVNTEAEDSTRRRSNLLSSSSTSSNQKSSPPIDSLDIRHPISSNSLTVEKPNLINSTFRSYHDQKDLQRLDSIDSSNLVVIPIQKLKSDDIKSGGNNWNIRLCFFLLLSLVVLMVYGRIYSILFTSTWFYVMPRRHMKQVNSVSKAVKFSDCEEKKRVIMAGLLDRARNPLR